MKQVTDIKLLMRAYYHACQAKDWDDAAAIVLEAYDFLRYGNYFQLLKDLCEGLLPVNWQDKQKLVASTSTHIDILYRLGVTYHDLGKFVDSNQYLQVCYELAKQTKDRIIEVDSRSYIALNYQHLEKYELARECLEDCLIIVREISEYRLECRVLQFLGKNYDYLGNHQKAIALYLQGLEIARQHAFFEGESTALGNLGFTYTRLKNYDRAFDCMNQCLATFENYYQFSQRVYAQDISNFRSIIKDSRVFVDFIQQQVEMSVDLASCNSEISEIDGTNDISVLMAAYDALEEWKNFTNIFEKCLDTGSEKTSLHDRVNCFYRSGVIYYKILDVDRVLGNLASRDREVMLLLNLVKVILKGKIIFAKDIESNLREAEQICAHLQMPFLAKVEKLQADLQEIR
jgi:tetratricopeptide (TPR) repeat protein